MKLIAPILLLIVSVQAIHFYVHNGETKCFYENLSQGNLMFGDLDGFVERDAGIFEADSAMQLTVTIDETFDNDHRVMTQKNSHEGDFTFTALDTGEHRICITPTYPSSDVRIRVFLDIDITSVQVLDSKRKEDMDSLKGRIQQLLNKIGYIRTEQRVLRQFEAKFRDQSEAANSKIVFWAILQIIALGGACAFQLRYLKNFFVKQKVL